MRQSDEYHFAAFVAANSATLFRTAYLMTGDYHRAEDLVQTTLVRVYQRWSRVEVMDRPVAYPLNAARTDRGSVADPSNFASDLRVIGLRIHLTGAPPPWPDRAMAVWPGRWGTTTSTRT